MSRTATQEANPSARLCHERPDHGFDSGSRRFALSDRSFFVDAASFWRFFLAVGALVLGLWYHFGR